MASPLGRITRFPTVFGGWGMIAGPYALLVALPTVLVVIMLASGAHIRLVVAVPSQTAFKAFVRTSCSISLLTLQIGVVLGVTLSVGAALERLGQPRVVGEMIGGILLGPSVLGRLGPNLFEAIFPSTSNYRSNNACRPTHPTEGAARPRFRLALRLLGTKGSGHA